MSEHEESKGALDKDNPDPPEGEDGEKGLGTDTGAEVSGGTDMPGMMPEDRGEVRYPDSEDVDEQRPEVAPQEGHVEEDPDRSHDASKGAKD